MTASDQSSSPRPPRTPDLATLAETLDAAGSALLCCEASGQLSQPLLFAGAAALSARDALIGLLAADSAALPSGAPSCLHAEADPRVLAAQVLAIAADARRLIAASPTARADPQAAETATEQLTRIVELLEPSAAAQ